MSIFGKVFGDSKDSDPSAGAQQLADISRQLLSQTNPLRQSLIDRYSSFASASPAPVTPMERLTHQDLRSQLFNPDGTPITGNSREGVMWDQKRSEFENLDRRLRLSDQMAANPQSGPDVTGSPQFASLKDAINRQFSIARDNVLASTPSGGALSRNLTNLEGQRAATTASGIGSLYENELSRALGLATGQTPTALGGLGTATGIAGQIQAAQAAQQGQALQGLGYGVGSAMGRKGTSNAGAKSSTGSASASTAA